VKWENELLERTKYFWGQTSIDKTETWFRVGSKWFHVVKSEDGIHVNGKLFPEPTPYNERLKSMGWDFHEELLFVMEEQAEEIYVDVYCRVHKPVDKINLNFTKINLLPKESTMRTRYAVVNLKEKVEFEKEWELSYGYNNSPKICYEQNEAIRWIKQNLGPNERKEYVVERHNAGKVDVVWKIVPGWATEQEEEEYED